MYDFARRPRWVLSHLFALALVVLFVNLGFWQLSRHDDKVARNADIAAAAELAPVPVETLDAPADYRRVVAEGRYLDDATLVVDNRSFDGLPGGWIVTPLQVSDGPVVAVLRGFQQQDDGRVAVPPTPTGVVRIEGTATSFVTRSCGVRTGPGAGAGPDAGSGPDGDAGAVLDADAGERPVGAACLRRDVVDQLAGETVSPVVVQRAASVPDDAASLVPVPLPELDEGPHRSYAVQWFIFATIGTVGYPLILRRVARDRARPTSPQSVPA